MYHPSGKGGGKEFIEVMNTSESVTLDLGGVRFTRGIEFSFASGTRLAPGARVVVTQSQFENGTALGNGGETIKIEDANSSTVTEFAFDDTAPWPTAPDGGGPSLILIQPEIRPNPNITTNCAAAHIKKAILALPTRSRSAARIQSPTPLSIRLE